MKYNDNGTYKDIYVKAFDTLPVGTEVDYIGDTVPDGWSEVDSYSTNEVDTGQTWIDGKKIYRKTYTGYATARYTIVTSEITTSTINILREYGMRKSKYGSWFAVNSYYGPDATNYYSVITFDSNGMQIIGGNSMFESDTTNCPYIITIEYTKVS